MYELASSTASKNFDRSCFPFNTTLAAARVPSRFAAASDVVETLS
jgi:hypothetical protein